MARTNATNYAGALQFPKANAATDLFKKEDLQVLAEAVDQHDHSTGKGLALPPGSLSQTGLASGATASPTTTSSTLVDLPDMAVTLTTTGGDVLVWLTSSFTSSVVGMVASIALRADAGSNVAALNLTQPGAANGLISATTFWRFTGLTAGSHTFSGRWSTNSGTLTAYTTARYLMAVELKR